MKKHWKIILLFVVMGLASAGWLLKDRLLVSTNKAIKANNINTTKNISLISVPKFYNQQDEKWAKDRLGKTNETVGKVGCLISSVGMNLSYYGLDMNPKVINEALSKIDGYTSRGWLIWKKLNVITEGKIKISFPTLSHENIEKYLFEQKPVLAKVFIARVIPHWVLIIGQEEGEYMILDPLSKEGQPIKASVYGNYIYSIRILENNN